jgi:hypothetical protein
MEPKTEQEYQKLLTEVIRKQIVILGPSITLAKARNVQGLTVADDGTVTSLNGNPQLLTQQLIEQFMELSGLIVKKTMEPLLTNYPGLTSSATNNAPKEVIPAPIADEHTDHAAPSQPDNKPT